MSMEIVITYEKSEDVIDTVCSMSARGCILNSRWTPDVKIDQCKLDTSSRINCCNTCDHQHTVSVSEMRTRVEIYTLPIVAVARMDVLSKAGFAPCLTVTRTPIVEVN
jgi:hypothetical protein